MKKYEIKNIFKKKGEKNKKFLLKLTKGLCVFVKVIYDIGLEVFRIWSGICINLSVNKGNDNAWINI